MTTTITKIISLLLPSAVEVVIQFSYCEPSRELPHYRPCETQHSHGCQVFGLGFVTGWADAKLFIRWRLWRLDHTLNWKFWAILFFIPQTFAKKKMTNSCKNHLAWAGIRFTSSVMLCSTIRHYKKCTTDCVWGNGKKKKVSANV